MNLQVVLGNQLFPLSFYTTADFVFMSEDHGLCTHFKYHKHKLIFFLASMRNFRDELKRAGKEVEYFELDVKKTFLKNLEQVCLRLKVTSIQIYEIEDKFFEDQVKDFCENNNIDLSIQRSPMFLVARQTFHNYNSKAKKPFMKTFYENVRRVSNILMEENGKPEGGKFSYDTENRKKVPKKFDVIQNKIKQDHDTNTKEVIKLIDENFPDHPGSGDNFWMHTTRQGALEELDYFIQEKFELFGPYEDAIDLRDPFLYHSVMSPYINIGFVTPSEIVKVALAADVSLNSKEGFVRQVIGWREFVRGIYQEYSDEQDKSNFFGHQNKLTSAWYEGSTGITPLDDAIKKVDQFGYCHHIERLMIISNIMLLCEIHPQEVHRWFMEMFVDSSDWVMGPNVYGMAQFSDGGIFATKPYISSSNYILKMSHYKKDEWCDVLDGLYWRFIEKNRDFFSTNYRMSMMVKMLDKMDLEKKERIFPKAESFIKEMTRL
jgi:deoxyribodipyrimidine photolyase-related protein